METNWWSNNCVEERLLNCGACAVVVDKVCLHMRVRIMMGRKVAFEQKYGWLPLDHGA